MRVEGRGEERAAAGSLAAVGVGLHVAVEVTGLREPEVADLAAIRLLPAVDALVLGECGGVCEGLAAVVAPVRPLPGVGS